MATTTPPEALPTSSEPSAGTTNPKPIGLTVGPAVGGTFVLVALLSFCFCSYIRPRRQRTRETSNGNPPGDNNSSYGQKPELDTANSGSLAEGTTKKERDGDRSPPELTGFSPPTELNSIGSPAEMTRQTRPTELRLRIPTGMRNELGTSPVSPVGRAV